MQSSRAKDRSGRRRSAAVAVTLPAAATATCAVLDREISLMSQAMIYLLAVVAASYQLPRLAANGSAIGFFFVRRATRWRSNTAST